MVADYFKALLKSIGEFELIVKWILFRFTSGINLIHGAVSIIAVGRASAGTG